MEYRNLCQNCGSDLRKVTDTHYACVHCNTVYSNTTIEIGLVNNINIYRFTVVF